MSARGDPRRVSILVLPGMSAGTPVNGLFETLAFGNMILTGGQPDALSPFEAEIVGPSSGVLTGACGLPMQVHRTVWEVARTDIVIAPSMFMPGEGWELGRYPEVVAWLRDQHAAGADLCSTCAGALILAETGLLDGRTTTTHWAFADTFRRTFPKVRLRLDELLVVEGARGEFVMSGAANSWQDLILYMIARHLSPRAAQDVGKFLLYQWNTLSQAPFMPFSPQMDHGDGAIRAIQNDLHAAERLSLSVDDLAEGAGLARATFSRRFVRATGHAPLDYLQRLRVERAKALLEDGDAPVEEIGWRVGYEEPAAFRRVFRRITRMTPSEYRRRFRLIRPARMPLGPVTVSE